MDSRRRTGRRRGQDSFGGGCGRMHGGVAKVGKRGGGNGGRRLLSRVTLRVLAASRFLNVKAMDARQGEQGVRLLWRTGLVSLGLPCPGSVPR